MPRSIPRPASRTAALPQDDRPLDERHRLRLRTALLRFYDAHKRDLPWRHTRDPYAIWVSEIMLQQTQVDTVKPRYLAFLREFPTVAKLAAASEQRVCEAWAGLGYYRRARNLHAAARRVIAEHGGRLPGDARGLLGLPGVGRYTAGAIASIAYGERVPVLDGNVKRVLARLFGLDVAPESATGQKLMWGLAGQLAAGPRPGDLNQAMMELGATVCTPASPGCGRCCWARWCVALAQQRIDELPRATAKAPRQKLYVAFAWCEDTAGVWLRQRSLDGLWAGLWEPPGAQGSTAASARSALAAMIGGAVPSRAVSRVAHVLTHRDVSAGVYRVAPEVLSRMPSSHDGGAPRPWPDPLRAPLSALARKAIVSMARPRGAKAN